MKRASILALTAALILMAVTAGLTADQAFLWNGDHWKQVPLDGKVGYIFGIGNLADFEVAAGGGRGRNACISRAFVADLKKRTVMQIVQEVDKYYQDNPGKLYTSVLEVVLQRCTTVCPAEAPGGATKK